MDGVRVRCSQTDAVNSSAFQGAKLALRVAATRMWEAATIAPQPKAHKPISLINLSVWRNLSLPVGCLLRERADLPNHCQRIGRTYGKNDQYRLESLPLDGGVIQPLGPERLTNNPLRSASPRFAERNVRSNAAGTER